MCGRNGSLSAVLREGTSEVNLSPGSDGLVAGGDGRFAPFTRQRAGGGVKESAAEGKGPLNYHIFPGGMFSHIFFMG